MYLTSFVTKTPTTDISINVKAICVPSVELNRYENKERFSELCRIGCPNYNNKWSCPPHSPSYTQYSKPYTHAVIILFSCELEQFTYIKTEYMKVKAANSILKSQIEKILRASEKKYDGTMISNGSCRLCKPCSCKGRIAGCRKPEQKRFSLESLGINVEELSLNLFDHKLLWYGHKRAPKYTSVLSCLLVNCPFSDSMLSEILKVPN